VGVDVLCGGAVGAPLPGVAAPEGGVAALLRSPDPALPWLLLAAHITVGLIASAWLRRGESALAGLVRSAAAFAFRPLRLVIAVAGAVRPAVRRRPRPASRPRPSRTRLLVHSVGRRGPPCRAALAV
jgi:hypothetical protein